MSSGFLLLETMPGHEGHVLEKLARTPGVTFHTVLWPAAIAVRIEAPLDGMDPLASQLRGMDGVVATRLYRARNA